MECVADVSFVACWFVEDEPNPDGFALLRLHEKEVAGIHLPYVWNFELLNFLKSCFIRKRLTAEGLADSQKLLNRLELSFHDQTAAAHRKRILNFAMDYNLTGYDAAYLELADRLQLPLLTRDRDLKEAVKQRNLATSLNFKK